MLAQVYNEHAVLFVSNWSYRGLFQIGWHTLQDEFSKLLSSPHNQKEHDNIYDELKTAVRDESMKKHKWDDKAEDSLVIYS